MTRGLYAIAPQTCKADVTSAAIDTAGAGSLQIVAMTGAYEDTTFTISLTECDTSTGAFSAVDGDSIKLASTDAAAKVTVIGYSGYKRYIKVAVATAGTKSTGSALAVAVLKTLCLDCPTS